MSVDLKPVALDVCLKTSSELPQGQICQPFSFHLGVTWFGMEIFGLNFGGESRIVMQDLPKKPAIDWPAQQNAAAPHDHHRHPQHDPHGGTRRGACLRRRPERRPEPRTPRPHQVGRPWRRRTVPRVLLKDSGRPLVLVGPPRHVRGELLVRNPGDEKVIVRQPLMRPATIAGRGKAKAAGAAGARPSRSGASSSARDRIGRCRSRCRSSRARRRARITRSWMWTASGATVVLHVTEDVAFTIEPSELVIPNRPGEKVEKRIVVSNQGNVAIVREDRSARSCSTKSSCTAARCAVRSPTSARP